MNQTNDSRWRGTAAFFVAALGIGLCTELVTPRAQSLGTALTVLLLVAGAGVGLTILAWPGCRFGWRGHRRGLAAAVVLLLLLTGVCAGAVAFSIGMRGLTM